MGFAFAFVLSTVTIIFTGLMVGAPKRDGTSARPRPEAVQPESRPSVTGDLERSDAAAETLTRADGAEQSERERTPSTAERQ